MGYFRNSFLVTGAGLALGAFLGLKHFINRGKDLHWIGVIERPLTRLGRIEAVELGLVLPVRRRPE